MKVLVTGATGNVGKHVVPALLKKHEVRVAVLNAEEAREMFDDAPLEIMEIDFAEAEQPAFDTLAKGVDAVVHLAAIGVVDPGISKEKIFKVNVEATKKLLKACSSNKNFKRFVFISSSALYHSPWKLPIEENDSPSPGNAYGESKVDAEEAVRSSGLPFVILRPVVIYGLGFETSFSPIVKAIQKQKFRVIGDGNARFAVVHIDDLVDAIMLSLEKKDALGEAFNISGEALTQKQWLEAVSDALGVPAPTKTMPVWVAEAIAFFYELKGSISGGKSPVSRESIRRLTTDRVFSTKKAERILGWKPKVDYRDGLSEIIASILAKK